MTDVRSRIQQFDRLAQNNAPQARVPNRGQRLRTQPLENAKVNGSNNPVVRAIWDAVEDYNRTWTHPTRQTPAQQVHALAVLDFIIVQCSSYMCTKYWRQHKADGHTTARRGQRYQAFEGLLHDVERELGFMGGRKMTGPNNFRVTNNRHRNYWLERLDPQHRAGYSISQHYAAWTAQADENMTFAQYLDNNLLGEGGVRGYGGGVQWQHHKHFARDGTLRSGDDTRFDTAGLRTEFSGNGWAVFVASLAMNDQFAVGIDNFLFSNTHHAGVDHHSSFLGGASVMAAGEWVVRNGVIQVITAKSGHYRPTPANMQRLVNRFREIPADAIIRPDLSDTRTGNPGTMRFYRVGDFRAMFTGAPFLRRNQVWNKVGTANRDLYEHYSNPVRAIHWNVLLPP